MCRPRFNLTWSFCFVILIYLLAGRSVLRIFNILNVQTEAKGCFPQQGQPNQVNIYFFLFCLVLMNQERSWSRRSMVLTNQRARFHRISDQNIFFSMLKVRLTSTYILDTPEIMVFLEKFYRL
jgi:hypothetical protein